MKNIFACDFCHYLFGDEAQPEQCPDCGKYKVRPATDQEIEEFVKRKSEVYDE